MKLDSAFEYVQMLAVGAAVDATGPAVKEKLDYCIAKINETMSSRATGIDAAQMIRAILSVDPAYPFPFERWISWILTRLSLKHHDVTIDDRDYLILAVSILDAWIMNDKESEREVIYAQCSKLMTILLESLQQPTLRYLCFGIFAGLAKNFSGLIRAHRDKLLNMAMQQLSIAHLERMEFIHTRNLICSLPYVSTRKSQETFVAELMSQLFLEVNTCLNELFRSFDEGSRKNVVTAFDADFMDIHTISMAKMECYVEIIGALAAEPFNFSKVVPATSISKLSSRVNSLLGFCPKVNEYEKEEYALAKSVGVPFTARLFMTLMAILVRYCDGVVHLVAPYLPTFFTRALVETTGVDADRCFAYACNVWPSLDRQTRKQIYAKIYAKLEQGLRKGSVSALKLAHALSSTSCADFFEPLVQLWVECAASALLKSDDIDHLTIDSSLRLLLKLVQCGTLNQRNLTLCIRTLAYVQEMFPEYRELTHDGLIICQRYLRPVIRVVLVAEHEPKQSAAEYTSSTEMVAEIQEPDELFQGKCGPTTPMDEDLGDDENFDIVDIGPDEQ